MGGRDDSALFTGSNGQTNLVSPRGVKVKQKQAMDKEQRLELQNRLFPAAEIIFAMLDYEEQLVTAEIANMPITVTTTEENVKEVLMHHQRNLRMIKRLRKKFERALAQPKLTPEEIDAALEGFEDDDESEG